MFISDHIGAPGAYEAISPTSAKSISAAILQPTAGEFINRSAVAAFITVEDAGIHFTLNGTTPTTIAGGDVGHALAAGESLLLRGKRAVKGFQCIDQAGASKVKVTTYF